MLTDKQILEIKRRAGMQLILEYGLFSWLGDEDMNEVTCYAVHQQVVDYIRPGCDVEAILDQEWAIVTQLSNDIIKIAKLYDTRRLWLKVSLL